MARDRSERLLVIVGGGLICGFLLATLLAFRLSSSVGELSDALIHETMPRIEDIAVVRSSTRDVQLALADLLHGPAENQVQAHAALDSELANLEHSIATSVVNSSLPGEYALNFELRLALVRFESAVARTRAVANRDLDAARRLFQTELMPAAAEMGDRAMRDIELNAQHGRELALVIASNRGLMIWLSYLLVGIPLAIAAIGVIMYRRQTTRRFDVMRLYAQNQELRADELEQFAGRVAHDIRNPLSAATLAVEILDHEIPPAELRNTTNRLRRALARAATITDGLLAFARAGATPDPGARANVREVITDIADSVQAEVKQVGIAVEVAPLPAVLVTCSDGVLSSLVGNLLRNAIKYMGDATHKKISIRASQLGDMVRVEVTDTGVGISEQLLPRLFEPYFRGVTNNQAGLGLGLTTVRKLAEGHGGKVGVHSTLGVGSTFWFELPHGGPAWQPGDDEVVSSAHPQIH